MREFVRRVLRTCALTSHPTQDVYSWRCWRLAGEYERGKNNPSLTSVCGLFPSVSQKFWKQQPVLRSCKDKHSFMTPGFLPSDGHSICAKIERSTLDLARQTCSSYAVSHEGRGSMKTLDSGTTTTYHTALRRRG